MLRYPLLFLLSVVLLCCSPSTLLAQTSSQLQLVMIGNGPGPYYAPAGQTTQLKVEVLNIGSDDVFIIRGEVYLDPDMSGSWQLTHSEDLGNFHLVKLESAVWTFELQMPPQIRAQNITNGVPQVELLMKISYLIAGGLKGNATAEFLLSVPGAATTQIDYSTYLILLGTMVVAIVVVIMVRNVKSRSIRKAQS